jgi:hypothetical protein
VGLKFLSYGKKIMQIKFTKKMVCDHVGLMKNPLEGSGSSEKDRVYPIL